MTSEKSQTLRKQAEEEFRQSEVHHQLLSETMLQGMINQDIARYSTSQYL